jgi:hypothetical protein
MAVRSRRLNAYQVEDADAVNARGQIVAAGVGVGRTYIELPHPAGRRTEQNVARPHRIVARASARFFGRDLLEFFRRGDAAAGT